MSVETQGPWKPNTYDTRPTRKLRPWPVIAFELLSASPCHRTLDVPQRAARLMSLASCTRDTAYGIESQWSLRGRELARAQSGIPGPGPFVWSCAAAASHLGRQDSVEVLSVHAAKVSSRSSHGRSWVGSTCLRQCLLRQHPLCQCVWETDRFEIWWESILHPVPKEYLLALGCHQGTPLQEKHLGLLKCNACLRVQSYSLSRGQPEGRSIKAARVLPKAAKANIPAHHLQIFPATHVAAQWITHQSDGVRKVAMSHTR